jgi:hypothetical protein
MPSRSLIFLVEEQSMESFLRAWLPRILPEGCDFEIHAYGGKRDLLSKLESRLRAYAAWLPENARLIVIVDRDDDNCEELKRKLEAMVSRAGLPTRSVARGGQWRVATRIAIEELEAWYFGDWEAVRAAYPRASSSIPNKAPYRDPDAIAGGTWEAFERVMRSSGYFKQGLMKLEAARAIGEFIDVQRSRSRSFRKLAETVEEAVAE